MYYTEQERRNNADVYSARIAYEIYLLRMVVLNMFRNKSDVLPIDAELADFVFDRKPNRRRKPKVTLDSETRLSWDKARWLGWANNQKMHNRN